MRIKHEDLLLLRSFAHKFYIDCPGGRLPGDDRDLENSEIVALSYLDAVSRLMISNGWSPSDINIELEQQDSEPEAEYQDWENEQSP